MSSLRYEMRKDVKGAKAKYHSAEGYIRHLKHYLKHGDYCDDYYGAYGEKKNKMADDNSKGNVIKEALEESKKSIKVTD